MTAAVTSAGEQLACLMVPRGAGRRGHCPGGEPCGARRLLAIDGGHLDEHAGTWVTRQAPVTRQRSSWRMP